MMVPTLRDPRVVALGGGHGLAASLTALRRVTTEITAIVTVADNGGSSGRLRAEFGTLPPGDLRMALAALCGDDRWGRTWAEVLQHRFDSEGDLNGHSLGNLLIVALWDLLDDQVLGLDWVAGLLGSRGRVLPMSTTPLDITGTVAGPDGLPSELRVRGQAAVATTRNLLEVSLDPADPPACPDALEAIAVADFVVLGPGSWFTSVIPHLLVPDQRKALTASDATIVVVLNLEAQTGETEGYLAEDHLAVLHRHAPDLRVDYVIADPTSVPDPDHLNAYVVELGGQLVLADVCDPTKSGHHDPVKLAAAYAPLLKPT
ncbi:MAG: uridine diphosphate-N-acetylglucosamine-binding protein YvcK [Marmoricola sp.]